MASSETPPLSLRQGVRIVSLDSSVMVEEVLLAVGEQVGHDKLSFASRLNKAVVVFLKQEPLVYQLIESGVFIRDMFMQVSPLLAPSMRITVSGVPPFIQNELLEKELRKFGKFSSGLKTVSLGCKDPKLRHVQSLRRQLFMFLDSPTQTLEVFFRVKHGDGSYIVYASSGQLKYFQCGGVGHKRANCPHRKKAGSADTDTGAGATPADEEPVAEPKDDGPVVVPAEDGPGARPAVADCGTAGAVAGVKDKDEKEQSQAEEQQADVAENSSYQTGQPQPAESVEEAASTSVEPSVSNSQLERTWSMTMSQTWSL
ncbi:hypothetical protein VZT92_004547 [Zoarces viviparus]|uniref:Gag-like protein n=1 Tax=Zoarces viviparus TaxID=48416 RepID=A0AAW1G0A1_ZOAVI